MKIFCAGILAITWAAACIPALSSAAQTSAGQTPAAQQNGNSNGQVIFSRSTDQNGETKTVTAPVIIQSSPQAAEAPVTEDAERQAVTYTDFDMDVRLHAAAQQIAIRALVTVRNDGKTPLTRLPLQISSSLNWEQIRLNGKSVVLQITTLNSDADHTGQLHEAIVPLAKLLAPGAALQLDLTYSGTIPASSQRLLAIGTPQEVALHSDWDQISADFTGLRGFGNVVWYPVSSVPVVLGDGARLFDEIGEHKLHLAGARFRLRLTTEFPHGQAPTVALVNGHSVPLTLTESGAGDLGQEVAGVATASLERATLGFEAPSLFVAIRTAHPGTNFTAWTLPENNVAAEAWVQAAATVTPFLQGWLGQTPRSRLTLLDLPDPQDSPFETGALLATSLREAAADQLNGILAHSLTHAWVQSPRAWLSEGVAHFMGTLWVEKQRGRDQALGTLESARSALTLAEPESPGQSAGQPLAAAISPVYYRTKAAYVLWMLRDAAGDAALGSALRAYDPTKDLGKDTGRSSFEKLIEQAGLRRDLAWFFTDWVDTDKGLPDLTIEGAFTSIPTPGSWLVAVHVANNGYAAAEVPVTVRSADASATQRVLVPARGKAVQRILIQSKPTEVQVNDGTVPETQASVHLTKMGESAADPAKTSSSNPAETPKSSPEN